MSLNLSTSSLRSLLALTERRDGLLAEIQKIESEISDAFQGGSSGRITAKGHKVGNGRKPGRPAKVARRGKRGKVKELILAGLKEAGEAGIAVKHLAAQLAIKPQNIHVWLHTTGKKNGLTEALGRGVYRLKKSVGVETDQKFLEVPKPKAVKPARKIRAKKKA